MSKYVNGSASGPSVMVHRPAASHFGLGVDVLVTSAELSALQSDPRGLIPAQRGGGNGQWVPSGSERFSGWAASLEVPGI